MLVSAICSLSRLCDCTIKLHGQGAVRSTGHQQVSDGAVETSMKTLNKEKGILCSDKAEGQCNWNSRSITGSIRGHRSPAIFEEDINSVSTMFSAISMEKCELQKFCQSLK